MSGKTTRSKGRRGQTAAKNLLRSRDWSVADLTAGDSCEDFIATDPDGKVWSVEAKNTKAITVEHRKQAMGNAKKSRMPWMLISHVDGTSSYLIQRQGEKPTVWSEK